MRIWTYEELDAKVRQDLDIEQETFIQTSEMLGYANEAIDEAEAEILKLHQDYFLTSDALTLVSGTDAYDLPADIYGGKLRGVIYRNGSTRYMVQKYRRMDKFAKIMDDSIGSGANFYKYYIRNSSTLGNQMVLVKTPVESGAFITRWYIRNAARMVDGTSRLDIPEFANFVLTCMKGMCRAKDNGMVMPADAAAMIQQQRQMMVDTLGEMIEDDDDTVEGDFSHYEEHA